MSDTHDLPDDPRKGLDDVSESQRRKGNTLFYGCFSVIGGFLLLFIIALIFPSSPDTPVSTNNRVSESQKTYDDTSWVPDNFTAYSDDSNVAWRWLKKSEYDCEYGDYCFGMMVTTRDGCPNSLYAEITLFDQDDIQIGYTNESVGSVSARGKAKLIFETYQDGTESGRVAEISCY